MTGALSPRALVASGAFEWGNDGRLVRFAPGARHELATLVERAGFARPLVLVGRRADKTALAALLPGAEVVAVGPGRVDELSAELLPALRGHDLVAIGGGRVIDCAKAVAAVTGARCAAVPTTLSGAEMTGFHRLPRGYEQAARGMVRPELVVWDPDLLAEAPQRLLAESAANALAHALEALYTKRASPVASAAALACSELLAAGLRLLGEDGAVERRELHGTLALGALLAGWASGEAGIAFHHALCQTLVRELGCAHATTNAAVLAASARHAARSASPAVSAWLEAFLRGVGVGASDATTPTSEQALAVVAERLAAAGARPPAELLNLDEREIVALARTAAAHPAARAAVFPCNSEALAAVLRDAVRAARARG